MTPHKAFITRTQTGVRIESRLLKVLKALAELHDMSLADLLEGIALHALHGKLPFSPATLAQAATLREVYSLTLTALDSHPLIERNKEHQACWPAHLHATPTHMP